MKHVILSTLFAFILLSGCGKKDPVTLTKKEILVAGGATKSWIVTSITGTTGGKTTEVSSACDKDDTAIFNSDGTYSFDRGKLKCNSTDPQTVTGTYTISADETTFTATEKGSTTGPIIYKIEELTASKFSLSLTTSTQSGNLTITVTSVPN